MTLTVEIVEEGERTGGQVYLREGSNHVWVFKFSPQETPKKQAKVILFGPNIASLMIQTSDSLSLSP